jgi:2-iminobutanoate/2-iminopropanoate deaminase
MKDPLFLRAGWHWDDGYPMCHMVKAGDFLWLTGQVAFDEDGRIVGPGDIQAQARQVFTNMRRVLDVVGCDLTSVIRLTSYLTTPMTDMEVTRKYWDVRQEFFGDHRPASTGIRVAGLMLPEMMIEVDAIAYAPNAAVHQDAQVIKT